MTGKQSLISLIKNRRMYYYYKLRRWLKDTYAFIKLKKFYNTNVPEAPNSSPLIIFMCDGHRHHGGLGDRLSGLISTYAYCKQHGKNFKIYWVSPYQLTDFLLPQKYNWVLNPNNISYNSKNSTPVYISYRESLKSQQKKAHKLLFRKECLQTHVYSNMKYPFPINFKFLFNELFRPSLCLKEAIDKERECLPKDYISVTFRFQQLLGDFEEGNFPIIKSEEKRELLIEKCIKQVELIHKKEGYPKKILVTSDSTSFLSRVSELPYVQIIKGEMVHVDFNTKDVNNSVHMKSFIDLFLLSGATKIYSVIEPPLYPTGFPMFASLVSGHELIEIY